MAKKTKQKIQLIEGVDPGLFGQKYSSRDYRYEESWGKNQFNSSFPASLVAYMRSKGLSPVFICTNKKNEIGGICIVPWIKKLNFYDDPYEMS